VAVSPAQDVIHFGLFELNLKAGQLTRNGSNLRLPQQPLQLLGLLLERPGEILTRDELRQRLWPSDVFVDFDHGLNKSIQKLRDTLGDSASSPRYIETSPRVGYRFSPTACPRTSGHPTGAADAGVERNRRQPQTALAGRCRRHLSARSSPRYRTLFPGPSSPGGPHLHPADGLHRIRNRSCLIARRPYRCLHPRR
jgi:DNA-binding winged helix-turn-helix (wHTH) protein